MLDLSIFFPLGPSVYPNVTLILTRDERVWAEPGTDHLLRRQLDVTSVDVCAYSYWIHTAPSRPLLRLISTLLFVSLSSVDLGPSPAGIDNTTFVENDSFVTCELRLGLVRSARSDGSSHSGIQSSHMPGPNYLPTPTVSTPKPTAWSTCL